MKEEQKTLWSKIQNFDLDEYNSDFTFTDRLARENDWTIRYSIRVIEEYKKFIFLLCNSDNLVTPSDQVDQVWHLHLIYTHSYWIDLCKNTIQRDIHHGPTKGGSTEKLKYFDLYKKTKELYYDLFRVEPPTDIWPLSKIRFGEIKFTRINRHRYWILQKPKIKKWKT